VSASEPMILWLGVLWLWSQIIEKSLVSNDFMTNSMTKELTPKVP